MPHTHQYVVHGQLRTQRFEHTRKIKGELKVVKEHLNKDFLKSIVGPRSTWLKTNDKYGEWDWIVTNFKELRLWYHTKFFFQTFGSIVFFPLGFFFMARSACSRNHLRIVGNEYDGTNCVTDADWWFINGMSVNSNMIKTNGRQIADIFNQKVHLFYNPTLGMLFDFAECLSGLCGHMNLITKRFSKVLIAHLHNPLSERKLVLVAHSQGCIITAAAVRHMVETKEFDGLRRMEIYTFGSPQLDWVSVVDPRTNQSIPYYEHFATEGDFVAQIGILRIRKQQEEWGKLFTSNVQGHFFGEHYMTPFRHGEYKHKGEEQSRLYSYMLNRVPTPQDAEKPPVPDAAPTIPTTATAGAPSQ